MKEYDRGIDQWLWAVYRPKMFEDKSYLSIQNEKKETDVNVCLFNQSYELMSVDGWWSNYFLQSEQQS
jgi:hypothetical protein